MTARRLVIIPFLCKTSAAGGEPDIDAILDRWKQRHPEHRGLTFHVIRFPTNCTDGSSSELVRVTADFTPEIEFYDPADDADLYRQFLAESNDEPLLPCHKMWVRQCEAAEHIGADYGVEKAMGYLIGEKLLAFLGTAETDPVWRAEIPRFLARIKTLFEPWHIVAFFETPRRLGVLGHVADDEGHEVLRSQLEESDKLEEDARNLMLFEWARELLIEEESQP